MGLFTLRVAVTVHLLPACPVCPYADPEDTGYAVFTVDGAPGPLCYARRRCNGEEWAVGKREELFFFIWWFFFLGF